MPVELEWESSNLTPNNNHQLSTYNRKKWLWILISTVVFLVTVILVAIKLRLDQVEHWQLQTLKDAYHAELIALRIGDVNTFTDLQHQGDEVWLNQQLDYFNTVQETSNLILSGEILESEITNNGNLGIIRFREVEDDIPYERLWFYWDFEGLGWRHLPQNTALWGDARTIQKNTINIGFFSRDEELANDMSNVLPRWLEIGCQIFSCDVHPTLQVDIIPDPNLVMSWNTINTWNLRIPSPLLTRLRSDKPFSDNLRVSLAEMLTSQLISFTLNQTIMDRTEDDVFYWQSVKLWVIGNFLERENISPLLQSIADHYGIHTLGLILQERGGLNLLPALRKTTNESLADLALLDWRDYLEWKVRSSNPGFDGEIKSLNISLDQEKIFLIAEVVSNSTTSELRFGIVGDSWQMLSE